MPAPSSGGTARRWRSSARVARRYGRQWDHCLSAGVRGGQGQTASRVADRLPRLGPLRRRVGRRCGRGGPHTRARGRSLVGAGARADPCGRLATPRRPRGGLPAAGSRRRTGSRCHLKRAPRPRSCCGCSALPQGLRVRSAPSRPLCRTRSRCLAPARPLRARASHRSPERACLAPAGTAKRWGSGFRVAWSGRSLLTR